MDNKKDMNMTIYEDGEISVRHLQSIKSFNNEINENTSQTMALSQSVFIKPLSKKRSI